MLNVKIKRSISFDHWDIKKEKTNGKMGNEMEKKSPGDSHFLSWIILYYFSLPNYFCGRINFFDSRVFNVHSVGIHIRFELYPLVFILFTPNVFSSHYYLLSNPAIRFYKFKSGRNFSTSFFISKMCVDLIFSRLIRSIVMFYWLIYFLIISHKRSEFTTDTMLTRRKYTNFNAYFEFDELLNCS